jgi:hypothetical protein
VDERINVTSLNRSPTHESPTLTTFFNSFVHTNQSAVLSKMNTDVVPDGQQHTRLQIPPYDSRSPTHTSSSVLSSSSSTTRLSFQTLTNLVPWPSRNRPPTTPRSPPISPNGAASPTLAAFSLNQGGFVSREKQLRKLQMRMQLEGMAGGKSCVHVQCKKCSGEVALI